MKKAKKLRNFLKIKQNREEEINKKKVKLFWKFLMEFLFNFLTVFFWVLVLEGGVY